MTGYTVTCPFCGLHVQPDVGLLHLLLAPRLAHHMWDAHSYETRILLLHLSNPPAEWPEVEVAA